LSDPGGGDFFVFWAHSWSARLYASFSSAARSLNTAFAPLSSCFQVLATVKSKKGVCFGVRERKKERTNDEPSNHTHTIHATRPITYSFSPSQRILSFRGSFDAFVARRKRRRQEVCFSLSLTCIPAPHLLFINHLPFSLVDPTYLSSSERPQFHRLPRA